MIKVAKTGKKVIIGLAALTLVLFLPPKASPQVTGGALGGVGGGGLGFYTQNIKEIIETEYFNIAREGISNYIIELYRAYFDMFGNFLVEGYDLYTFDTVIAKVNGASRISKSGQFNTFFRNMVIASDQYKDTYAKVVVGNVIRTIFTPFTFYRLLLNGVRFDVWTPKWEGTLIVSRMGAGPSPPANVQLNQVPDSGNLTEFTLLVGGHGEVAIGDALKVGGTYLDIFHSLAERMNFKGALKPNPPSYVDLRFSDDSPQDGVFGASLFTIEAYVNGELVKKIDAVKDRPIQGLGDVVGNHRDANGGKSFVYRIDIPEKEFEVAGEKKVGRDYVKDVRIVCRVANDYRIEMATDKQPTFVLVAQKEGNVVEMGKAIKEKINKPEDVEIWVGTTGSRSIYGLNWKGSILGFDVRGEYAVMDDRIVFPTDEAQKGNAYKVQRGTSWFLVLQRRLGNFIVGYENYRVDPKWQGPYDPTARGYSNAFLGYPLIDDNDDRDRFPDNPDPFGHDPVTGTGTYGGPPYAVIPGLDENQNGVADTDENRNGVPDYDEDFLLFNSDPPVFAMTDDRNNNRVTDIYENDLYPDIGYLAPSIVIPTGEWRNLYRDQKGYAVTAGLSLFGGSLTLWGGMDRDFMITSERKSKRDYLFINYSRTIPGFGVVALNQKIIKAEDNIPNDTVGGTVTGLAAEFLGGPDKLRMRNASLWSTILALSYEGIANLKAAAKYKYERERHYHVDLPASEIQVYGTYDDRDITTGWLIFRLVYEVIVTEKLRFKPMYKLQMQSSRSLPEDPAYTFSETTQAFAGMLDYAFTGKTRIIGGLQHRRFRDRYDPTRNFNRWTGAIQLGNASQYYGYNIAFIAGYQHIFFPDLADAGIADTLFIRLYAGF